MIYLTKGQPLFNNEGMVVCSPTGYYEDGTNVLCAMYHSPDEPVYSYEAKYIAYGDQVYNVSNEDKLLEEIKKIDPETLIGKTNTDVNIDNLVQEIKTVDNPTPELTQDAVDTNNTNVDSGNTTTDDTITDTNIDNVDTTTEEVITTTDDNTTTTTYDEDTDTTTTITTDVITDDTNTDATIPDVTVPEPITTDQPVSMLSGKRKKKLI